MGKRTNFHDVDIKNTSIEKAPTTMLYQSLRRLLCPLRHDNVLPSAKVSRAGEDEARRVRSSSGMKVRRKRETPEKTRLPPRRTGFDCRRCRARISACENCAGRYLDHSVVMTLSVINGEILSCNEGEMRQRLSSRGMQGREETGIPRENPPYNGDVLQVFHVQKFPVTPPEIEPTSPRREAIVRSLASQLGEPGSTPGFSHVGIVPDGGFSRGSPVSPALALQRCSILTSLHIYRLSRLDVLPKYLHPSLHSEANRVQYPAGSLPDFCKRESRRTIPLVGSFSFPPPLHSSAAQFSPRFHCVGSQDFVVKIHPNIATQTGLICTYTRPGCSHVGNKTKYYHRLVGFLRVLRFTPPLHFIAAPYPPHFTVINTEILSSQATPKSRSIGYCSHHFTSRVTVVLRIEIPQLIQLCSVQLCSSHHNTRSCPVLDWQFRTPTFLSDLNPGTIHPASWSDQPLRNSKLLSSGSAAGDVFPETRPNIAFKTALLPPRRARPYPRPVHSGISRVGIVADDAASRLVFAAISNLGLPYTIVRTERAPEHTNKQNSSISPQFKKGLFGTPAQHDAKIFPIRNVNDKGETDRSSYCRVAPIWKALKWRAEFSTCYV
ncbi:hypothetical protein PR048_011592 [Dryococelus australis]|uniref:Uncharacterized protein n=1 Tax=Dryococelus australis TaxID=614101 RepID=A0ABQ9HM66_9NEOP|nr:hypothetical protein PR048_011592 [Dryococelus australis]